MENLNHLAEQIQTHVQQSAGYWTAIRLLRLAIKVNALEKENRRIIAHLNRTYEGNSEN